MDNKAFWRTFYGSILGIVLGISIGLMIKHYNESINKIETNNWIIAVFGIMGGVSIMLVQWFMTLKKETVEKMQEEILQKIDRTEFVREISNIKDEVHEYRELFEGVKTQVEFIYQWAKDNKK